MVHADVVFLEQMLGRQRGAEPLVGRIAPKLASDQAEDAPANLDRLAPV